MCFASTTLVKNDFDLPFSSLCWGTGWLPYPGETVSRPRIAGDPIREISYSMSKEKTLQGGPGGFRELSVAEKQCTQWSGTLKSDRWF
jgi:hypothetical protein